MEKYNYKYFAMLSSYLQIEQSNNLEVIEAKVGLITVFLRCLDKFYFFIAPGVEDWKLIEVSAHETLHFLWFEKLKTIHFKMSKKEYDVPQITW